VLEWEVWSGVEDVVAVWLDDRRRRLGLRRLGVLDGIDIGESRGGEGKWSMCACVRRGRMVRGGCCARQRRSCCVAGRAIQILCRGVHSASNDGSVGLMWSLSLRVMSTSTRYGGSRKLLWLLSVNTLALRLVISPFDLDGNVAPWRERLAAESVGQGY
jgi:hypothetical protein